MSKKDKQQILILGGAGFGGAGLTRRLVEAGHEITVLDLVAPRHASLLRDLYEYEKIDYRWKSTLDIEEEDVAMFDIIFDFAAQADVPMGFSSPMHTAYNNIMSVYRIMECIKEVNPELRPDKFIYMGSGTTFGPGQKLPIAEDVMQQPANPYSASKQCAETVILAYHRAYGIPVTILRNGIVYGPNMRKEIVIAKFIINALLGKPLIVEGGNQTRDMNYVDNTLDCLELLVDTKPEIIDGEVFHCATGVETSILDLAKMVAKMAAYPEKIQTIEHRFGEQFVRQQLDITKAREILGYEPKVFLEEGLKRTIEFFRSETAALRMENVDYPEMGF